MKLLIREKYTVKNSKFVKNNDDAIIIELNRGQKWELVGQYSSGRCTIRRGNVTIEIPVSDFNDIFFGER